MFSCNSKLNFVITFIMFLKLKFTLQLICTFTGLMFSKTFIQVGNHLTMHSILKSKNMLCILLEFPLFLNRFCIVRCNCKDVQRGIKKMLTASSSHHLRPEVASICSVSVPFPVTWRTQTLHM